MVLGQSVYVGVIGVQFRFQITTVRISVMRVGEVIFPVPRVVVSGFQTTLLRRFPFVIGLDLDALVLVIGRLVLVGREVVCV